MKLAQLAFEIVKDSIEFPSGINLEGFVAGDYDDDRDFSAQISSAFNYINLAFSRLVSDKKTLLKVTTRTPLSSGYIEFTEGTITSIINKLSSDYDRVHFTPFSKGVAIEPDFVVPYMVKGVVQVNQSGEVVCCPLYVEYRPKVPHFSLSDIRKEITNEDNEVITEEVVFDLEEYGITDEMCDYVKEYAKGGLMEYMSPDLSQKHTSMAETYFAKLDTQYSKFQQLHIVNTSGGTW